MVRLDDLIIFHDETSKAFPRTMHQLPRDSVVVSPYAVEAGIEARLEARPLYDDWW
jgi:hypothetical protein